TEQAVMGGEVGGAAPSGDSAVTFTIPLHVTVRLGPPTLAPVTAAVSGAVGAPGPVLGEAISIDPNYSNREGYDPEFLGAGKLRIELPGLSAAQRADAALARGGDASDPHELKYHHFSLVVDSTRRLAFFTEVNIDGRSSLSLTREKDKWIFDPRLDREEQVGDDLYKGTPFDRGHLVRRLDPAWGRTEQVARVANDDTFHF